MAEAVEMTNRKVTVAVEGSATTAENKETNRWSIVCIIVVISLYAPTVLVGQTTIRQYIMYNFMMQHNFITPLHGRPCVQFNDTLEQHEQKNAQKHGAMLSTSIIFCEAIFGMVTSLLIGPLTDR